MGPRPRGIRRFPKTWGHWLLIYQRPAHPSLRTPPAHAVGVGGSRTGLNLLIHEHADTVNINLDAQKVRIKQRETLHCVRVLQPWQTLTRNRRPAPVATFKIESRVPLPSAAIPPRCISVESTWWEVTW